MGRKNGEERQPKAFPQYDEAGHVDSAAVAPLPPYPQSLVQRGDPAATEYTERYCKPREKR